MDRVVRRNAIVARPGDTVAVPSTPSAIAWRLSVVVAVLMAAQSAVGVFAPEVYRDTGWVLAAWFGTDLVTLLVAVPLLAASLYASRRGSLRAELVWYAMLGYAVYNSAYYLFGATLNALFPVYAALFALPVFALILALGSLNAERFADAVNSTSRRRWIAGYMLLTGAGLALAWTGQWALYVIAGTVPSVGADAFRLVAAMDLTFVVPWFIVGAVLLLRRNAWGFVVAAMIIVKGATYTLALTAAATVAGVRGVEGSVQQIPIWAGWTVLGVLAAWALLGQIAEGRRWERRADPVPELHGGIR